MNLEELLNSKTPPKKDDLTDEDLARFFIKYKGLLKKLEWDEAFWAATNENIKRAYSKLDELVEERTSQLRESEEWLSTTLKSIGDAIIATNTKGNISFLNPVAESLTGWKQEDAIEKPIEKIFNIINEETRKTVENPVSRVIREGVVVGLANNTILTTKDGKEIPIADSGAPIKDKEGKILGVVLIFRDITERKKAERELKRIMDNIPALVLYKDTNDIATWVNQKYADALNLTKEEIIGKNTFDRFPEEQAKVFTKDDHEVIKTREAKINIEEPYYTPEGTRWGLTSKIPNIDEKGKVTGIIEFSIDITARKKAEEELKATLKDLKRSNTELEQFAYVASHDLQEPLRMVASFTQLLQNRYQDKLDDDANDFMTFIVEGALRLQNLINDLLIFSQVGTRGKPFKATDMNYILKSVLANSNKLIEENNVNITIDPLPVIIADESQMIQLFQNLISNAIKFHDKKAPRIHVSGEVMKNEWRFSVQDNGIGIGSKDLERIFLIFQRLHKNGEYPGRGIGLAICKKIIQRHGGRIWVESIQGVESTFYVSIPRNEFNN